ncbi:MAG: glycine cleavage system aminomethyltransferase GcvT [Acidimicrobiia bacterium]|nr:glycine cleavage system aminomethyltransferase GcvT [Acidimicrobiia bacterium]
MNRSPLHEFNAALGARFVDFGGWEMPVQFESVITEHKAVRNKAGFFDVTHLGRFELKGAGAHAALTWLFCNDVGRIEPGRSQYTMMLNNDGGIIDDLIVWWWDEEHYWVLPNAANHDRVMSAFAQSDGCEVTDLQRSTVLIALQGPDAPAVFESVLGRAPKRFRTDSMPWEGGIVSVAGTGYTGERGGEICTDPNTGVKLAEALIEAGVTPCGLGSRDTLRLEAGLALWGQDIDETTTPFEAGLDFAVSLDHEFVGKHRLVEQRREGISRRLTGFVLEDRGIPRHDHRIRTSRGGEGSVTSGNMSPMLQTGVGLAYISPPPSNEDSLEVQIRDRWVPGRIAVPPFHKQPA